MGIFDKWFKNSKQGEQEIHTPDTDVTHEANKKEEYDGAEEYDEAEQYKETEGYIKTHMVEEVKQKIMQFKAVPVQIVPVTYENFLETNLCLNFNVIVNFIELLKINYAELLGSKISKEDLEHLNQDAKQSLESLEALKGEVSLFRVRDTNLRNKIKEYTKIITQINNRKLKGEEFEKVKRALMPSIEAINKDRECFLKEEQELNERLQSLNEQMAKIYQAFEKIIKNIN